MESENVSASIQAAYEKAFNQIIARLFTAKKSDSYWQPARQAKLLKDIAQILDRLKYKSHDYLSQAILKLEEYETLLALEDLKEFRKAMKKAETWHAEYNEKYVQATFKDTFQHIAGQTDRMKLSIKADLRKDAMEVFRKAAVEGIPRVKAYRMLRDNILTKSPDFRFIDKAGRKWDNKQYFNMLTRTAMAQTQREIYANTLANEGHDLVKITQAGAKDACKNWESVVVSLTGATKGYPTLQEATESGEIFHPNCRHRFVAYDKSIDDLFEGRTT